MTPAEIFRKVGLSPRGPVRWRTEVLESGAGVYVVARVGDPKLGCNARPLLFIDPLPTDVDLDLEYERKRWLPNEPIVYVGKQIKQYTNESGRSFVTCVGIRVLTLAVK